MGWNVITDVISPLTLRTINSDINTVSAPWGPAHVYVTDSAVLRKYKY